MTPQSIDVQTSNEVVAIVLGGGRGTRLYPLTRERAKPAVPVGGRYRLVDIPLSNCINSGINRIFVLTQFNSRSLSRHINDCYKFDLFSRGFVEVMAAEQTVQSGEWFQGTADAIRQNLWHFRNVGCDHYLILSGDHLYRMDYREFFHRHLQTNADVTVATLPVSRKDAAGFGIMKVDSGGRIMEFVEKPSTDNDLGGLVTPGPLLSEFGFDGSNGREYLASMGVYLFRREVLTELLQTRQDWIDFGKDIIPSTLSSHRVYSHLFNGFWEDIGTVRSFYDVSIELVKENPPFNFLEPQWPIYTRPRYLPGSRVHHAHIDNCIVCEGTEITNASISESIVGIRSIVREGVSIRRSILMGADFFEIDRACGPLPLGIGRNSSIENAIVDKNARIGSNVVIRGGEGLDDHDDENYSIKDGIVIILKNAVIPDGSIIGKTS